VVTATLRLDTLRLNVVGTGWPARERVTIILSADPDATEGEALGTADTNRQGRFTEVVTLTAAPPETAYVIVTDLVGNREVALIRQRP
jgi:hypothetical protein